MASQSNVINARPPSVLQQQPTSAVSPNRCHPDATLVCYNCVYLKKYKHTNVKALVRALTDVVA